MRVAVLTREYPPDVYGGAGVHIEYLTRELAKSVTVDVHCWGEARPPSVGGPDVHAYEAWDVLGGPEPHAAALQALSINLAMTGGAGDADIVHSHTWYANMAGHLAKLTYGIPHVATVHSLEPMRPWKAEQLGGGYAISSWCERTALEGADHVIAVSEGHRRDIEACYPAIDPDRISVVYNGIDADQYAPDVGTDVLERHGIDPERPAVVFVGRITRQKGLAHLVRAGRLIDPDAQLVLCAGAPDTPQIAAEITSAVDALVRDRGNVVWIQDMLPKRDIAQILSHASVFVCPSIYEPLGIVNLEAMACEAPVVATATGGIPEVVVDGETGLLVPFEPANATGEPADPGAFALALAERVNVLLADPARARAMGTAGRQRAVEHFDWAAIAAETTAIYQRLLG